MKLDQLHCFQVSLHFRRCREKLHLPAILQLGHHQARKGARRHPAQPHKPRCQPNADRRRHPRKGPGHFRARRGHPERCHSAFQLRNGTAGHDPRSLRQDPADLSTARQSEKSKSAAHCPHRRKRRDLSFCAQRRRFVGRRLFLHPRAKSGITFHASFRGRVCALRRSPVSVLGGRKHHHR